MIPSNYNDGKGIRPTKPDTGPFDLGKDFEKLFMEILFMWLGGVGVRLIYHYVIFLRIKTKASKALLPSSVQA